MTDNFKVFKQAVAAQMLNMEDKHMHMFTTDCNKDVLWSIYLNSFPEGTNNIFRERREYDCVACKQFIRRAGAAVVIDRDFSLKSIWDCYNDLPEPYRTVAEKLSIYVKGNPISGVFISDSKNIGTDFNFDTDDPSLRWHHFHYSLARSSHYELNGVRRNSRKSECLNNAGVLKRGLDVITLEAIDQVLELIDSNTLYRGQEFRRAVAVFKETLKEYKDVSEFYRDNYVWLISTQVGALSGFKNTVIGTLVMDLSEGMDLEKAVRMYESKVAPANYKRPTALITAGMIKKAQETVSLLGIESALHRRHATMSDISAANASYIYRPTEKATMWDELTKGLQFDKRTMSSQKTMSFDDFMRHVVPMALNIEVLFENNQESNLMSLVVPKDPENDKSIFKWSNGMSWSYKGSVTDSIKEKVKKAGGAVDGVLRTSLAWYNYDDLDIHVFEPNDFEIYFGHRGKRLPSSAMLDVDMNAGGRHSREPVENIVWNDAKKMKEGLYRVMVHNYSKRETDNPGFVVELEFGGQILQFPYEKNVKDGERVDVLNFTYSRSRGVDVTKSIPHSAMNKEIWGLHTNRFHRVSAIIKSPNHWDEEQSGNLHHFFILDGCKTDEMTRVFYNEFLRSDLQEHRKVFEVLGSKLMIPPADQQLSGLGFSSTKRAEFICKVTSEQGVSIFKIQI